MADQWSIAWRVLDAQLFGVPQRRKRIYLICDFASGRAGQILFEPQRVFRDLAPGCSEKQNPPTNPRAGTHEASKSLDVFALRMRAGKPGGGKGPLVQTNLSGTLGCSNDQSIIEPLLFDHHPHDARVGGPCQIAPTVTARYGTDGGNTPIIATAYGFNALHEGRGAAVGRYGYPTEVSKTLDTSGAILKLLIRKSVHWTPLNLALPRRCRCWKPDFSRRQIRRATGRLIGRSMVLTVR